MDEQQSLTAQECARLINQSHSLAVLSGGPVFQLRQEFPTSVVRKAFT